MLLESVALTSCDAKNGVLQCNCCSQTETMQTPAMVGILKCGSNMASCETCVNQIYISNEYNEVDEVNVSNVKQGSQNVAAKDSRDLKLRLLLDGSKHFGTHSYSLMGKISHPSSGSLNLSLI